jgi:hypothetical protein
MYDYDDYAEGGRDGGLFVINLACAYAVTYGIVLAVRWFCQRTGRLEGDIPTGPVSFFANLLAYLSFFWARWKHNPFPPLADVEALLTWFIMPLFVPAVLGFLLILPTHNDGLADAFVESVKVGHAAGVLAIYAAWLIPAGI